ncbi:MAG: type II and III secretion system protein family protein [Planctomycetota bacterium]
MSNHLTIIRSATYQPPRRAGRTAPVTARLVRRLLNRWRVGLLGACLLGACLLGSLPGESMTGWFVPPIFQSRAALGQTTNAAAANGDSAATEAATEATGANDATGAASSSSALSNTDSSSVSGIAVTQPVAPQRLPPVNTKSPSSSPDGFRVPTAPHDVPVEGGPRTGRLGWSPVGPDFDRSRMERQRSGGLIVNTPVLPTMNPRPGAGLNPDEQWSRIRPKADDEPTGGFAGPLQGTDATIELILGQGRLLTLKRPIFSNGPRDALIAVGDPSVVDFEVLPNPQLIRLMARRAGVTDLTITGADSKTFSFEVRVLYDLPLLEAHLRQLFPDAMVKLSQIREHLVVEGQARSPQQVGQIIEVLEAYLTSMASRGTSGSAGGGGGTGGFANGPPLGPPEDRNNVEAEDVGPPGVGSPGGEGSSQPIPEGDGGMPAPDADGAPDGESNSDPDSNDESNSAADGAMLRRPRRTSAKFASTQASQSGSQSPVREPAPTSNFMTIPVGSPGGGSGGRSLRGRLINLLTVPGSQQVMLNVRIAELNRTAMRRIGADIVSNFGAGGTFNTRMSGATASAAGDAATAASTLFRLSPTNGTTAVAIVPGGGFDIALTALRQNAVVSILAEPNLIAYSGQQASFLAGGEFPVPVPQNTGAGVSNVGLQYKEYGVKLNFTPVVLTEDTIRLRVSPEASTIDLSTGTAISGTSVPGINTRRVDTTVELGQGQTLVLAGLLSVSIDAQTSRIPGLGDLPYLGPLFSNTSHQRVEKELLVLVTPFLVRPLNPEQLPPLPGCEVQDPNDLEFFFLNRIEGRTGRPFRSTTAWDDPWDLRHTLRFESRNVCGPVGFSDFTNKPLTDSPPPTPPTAAQRSSRR